jgi:hypothetical protein
LEKISVEGKIRGKTEISQQKPYCASPLFLLRKKLLGKDKRMEKNYRFLPKCIEETK